MFRKIIFLCGFGVFCFGVEQNCEQYFQERKAQLEIQTREFDEAKQALESYRSSFEILQNEKMQNLLKKEAEVNATLAEIQRLKSENEKLLEEKQRIQNLIDDKTQGRVKEIYSQMKDSAVAGVLNEMDNEEASKIMLSLESRKISGILSKMDPKKAGELTLLLQNIDNNVSKEQN